MAYERCYAADHDPTVDPGARRTCWADWLANDSEDQPIERVAYANQRLRELDGQAGVRVLPNDQPVPIPQRVHDYPPLPPGNYHTSGCDPVCEGRWRDCTNHCDLRDQPCKAACESEFRVCLDGCP